MQTKSAMIRRRIESVLRKYNISDDIITTDLYSLIADLLRESLQSGDNTWNHPAIRAVKQVCRENIPAGIFPSIIETLGGSPDIEKLTACYTEWHSRGKARGGWGWVLEWYKDGIPEKYKAADKNSRSLPFNV